MATYKELVGQKVTKVSSNPSDPKTGQMWYNSTAGFLRGLGIVEAWSSTTAMGTSRYGHGAAGNKNSGIVSSGRPPSSGPAAMLTSEEYDGSGWRATSNINTGRFFAGNSFGTETASVFAGGFSPSAPNMVLTELYDGSSFSESGDLSESKYAAINAGTTTAGLLAGGSPGRTSTEEFGGSSWTSGNATNTALEDRCGLGTQTAAIGMGGAAPPGTTFATTETEFYDGTSWTIGASLNNSRRRGSGGGTQTAGLVYGGLVPGPAASNKSEFYDGTSWTNNANMGTSRYYGYGNSSGGTFAVGNIYVAGGLTSPGAPNHTTAAEEYNRSLNTVTAAAWASGGNMTNERNLAAGAGSQTANIVFMGDSGAPGWTTVLSACEEYNGSTWSSVPASTPGAESNMGATGTSTSAVYWGGYPNVGTTVEWDGSSFSTTNPLNTGREKPGQNIGTQTAAVAYGGYVRPSTVSNATEEYDGSSWTASNNLNTARYGITGAGTLTAGLAMNGIVEPPQSNATEEYNGTSWTAGNASPYSAGNASSSGTQTAALLYGGHPGSPVNTTAGYDGTNWFSRANMGNSASGATGSSAGTQDLALRAGGYNLTSGQTEEFTGDTETANIANFTTS